MLESKSIENESIKNEKDSKAIIKYNIADLINLINENIIDNQESNIEPYKKQFLDELSNKGVSVQFRSHGKLENYDKSIELINKCRNKKY